jgi:hypothetical protein
MMIFKFLLMAFDVVFTDPRNYYYPDAAAADQGLTGNRNTIKFYVDLIGASEGTIHLRHFSGGASTTYTLSANETIPKNITLKIDRGAIISIDVGNTFTVYSPENIATQPTQQIVTGTGILQFTQGGVVHPGWWGAVGDGITNDYTALQAALTAYFATTSDQKGVFRFQPGLNYYIETGLTHTFSLNSTYPVVIDGRGSHITSGLAAGRMLTLTSAAVVRSVIIYPPMMTGNQSEDGCILIDGGTLASGHYFYNMKIIEAICEQFTGNGIELTNHIFESQIVRPYIEADATNLTGYGIFLNDTAAGNIGIIDILEPNTRGGLHGIFGNQGSAVINIRGGECLTAQEEGCKLIGATGGEVSGLHVENNWESAADLASGGAGLTVTGDVTVTGVSGTTVRNQKYTINVTPGGSMGTTVISVSALADTVRAVYCGNTAGSHLNLIGNMTVEQSGRNTKLSRMYSEHDTDAVATGAVADVETTLQDYTIPAYTLGQTGAVKIHVFGYITNVSGGNKTIKYYFGPVAYTVQAAANVSGDWELEVIVLGHNDANQRSTHKFWLNGALVTQGVEAPAQDQTADIEFKVTGECTNANDTVGAQAMRVEYM